MGSMRFSSKATRNYEEALHKLFNLQSNRTVTLGFERKAGLSPSAHARSDPNVAAIPEMLGWLQRAGYTPKDLISMQHIHVAGTKGKGSVCAYATSMLRNYRAVGTYTSPHLVSPRERIAINGEPVTQDIFARGFFEVWDRFTEAAREEGMEAEEAEGPASKPFFFRYLTILAWHIFLSQGVRDVVMECGIGGEYDATNVLPAEAVSAAVVTQLGLDHVSMLGGTVEKIAWHKAGIFKEGAVALTRRLEARPAVMEVLRARAREKGAVLVELEDSQVDTWGGIGEGLADYQKHNQALALMAVRHHLGMAAEPSTSFRDLPNKLSNGLRRTKFRGRAEILEINGQLWHLDGAHTTDSLSEVAKWFAPKISTKECAILIFNQQERDISMLLTSFISALSMASSRQDMFSHVLFTTNDLSQAKSGERRDTSVQVQAATTLRAILPECETAIFDNLEDAVAEAKKLSNGKSKRQKVLVTGSMHLVGGVMRVLEPQSLL